MNPRLRNTKELLMFFEGSNHVFLESAEKLAAHIKLLQYEGRASLGRNLKKSRLGLAGLKQSLEQQLEVEEKVVFPYLSKHVPKFESFILMLESEHREMKDLRMSLQKGISDLAGAKVRNRFMECLRELETSAAYLLYLMRHHERAEGDFVFKLVAGELNEEELRQIGEMIAACQMSHHGFESKGGVS